MLGFFIGLGSGLGAGVIFGIATMCLLIGGSKYDDDLKP